MPDRLLTLTIHGTLPGNISCEFRHSGDDDHPAIKFSSWSYRMVGLVALAAFLSALYQFQAGSYQPATLVFSALLNVLILRHVFANWRSFKRR